MKKLTRLIMPAFLTILFAAAATQAGNANTLLENRLKDSYNTMVLDVRAAPTATEKREILDGFLSRMDKGLGVVETMLPASNPSHAAAISQRARIQADRAELLSVNPRDPAAAANLNAFASYIQQDVEQADGVYLSVGALIIILIIVIILF